MKRPLTREERAAKNQRDWYVEEERRARETRGEKGVAEFWLRLARIEVARASGTAPDVHRGFALVCRLFGTAVQRRMAGDRRLWDDLIRYADAVVSPHQQTTTDVTKRDHQERRAA